MPRTLTVLIGDYNYNPTTQVHEMKFTYAGDPADVELQGGEETSIEVPSHAPPPQPKTKEKNK